VRQQHDLGGMSAGPLELKDDDPAPWAKMMTAIHGALVSRGCYNIDMSRRTVEDLPKEQCDLPYYERWMAGILNLLEETNLLTGDEIETRMAAIKQKLEAENERHAIR